MTQTWLMPGARGYTLLELIVVMVLVGILAVAAWPSLTASVGMRDLAWHDEVIEALRTARAVATSHRRVVCLSFSGNSVSLSIASTNPAASCSTGLPGPDGSTTYASSGNSSASTSVTQGGASYSNPLYFQPDGRVTTDLAGSTTGQWSINMTNAAIVQLDGVTGYAR